MFTVTDEDAAAIRAAFLNEGEFSAAIELRRRFRGISDNDVARDLARTIASWQPVEPVPPPTRRRRRGTKP